MLIGIKYHVPSKGIVGQNQIWRIYQNLDKLSKRADFNGMEGVDIEYVEHVEIEDVDSWTGENIFRIGYSLVLEGEIEYFIDPITGLRHARVYATE